MSKETVRVRFAPSPTGELHLGNARTAIFNWLFARGCAGAFILRIEDTDRERSRPEYQRMIQDDLTWLGLDWDEGPEAGGAFGPYLQSQRLDIYREHALRLEKEGLTYPCYCTVDELEARRVEAQEKGLPPRYDNRCRLLTAAQRGAFETAGRKPVTRFKVEPQLIRIEDLVRGGVEFDTALFGDFVILKTDGFPTFHFAVAVDDGLMKVSHVIRGEDHLSNTPRHILLFRALGFGVPRFAHLSMILGPDGSRLSKRHGATSVAFYRNEGYLPGTLLNALALLGWSSGDDREIFSREELVAGFSLDRVVASAAIFNPEKLRWVGEQHLRRLSGDDLARALETDDPDLKGRFPHERICELSVFMRERCATLKELRRHLSVFFQEPDLDRPDAVELLALPSSRYVLTCVVNAFEKGWTGGVFPVKSLPACQKELGVPAGTFYPLIRVCLTGERHGPELKDFCPQMGKDEVLRRLRKAMERCP